MPTYEKGKVRIHYEEAGSGFPLLLIAGGGLNATFRFSRREIRSMRSTSSRANIVASLPTCVTP